MEYNVYMGMWAHKHSYERLWPVYNLTVFKPVAAGSSGQDSITDDPYTDPKAPFHITTGTAVRGSFITQCSKF